MKKKIAMGVDDLERWMALFHGLNNPQRARHFIKTASEHFVDKKSLKFNLKMLKEMDDEAIVEQAKLIFLPVMRIVYESESRGINAH